MKTQGDGANYNGNGYGDGWDSCGEYGVPLEVDSEGDANHRPDLEYEVYLEYGEPP